MKALKAIQLDGDAERVRRDVHDAITTIQQAPILSGKTLANISLADGVLTPIPHTLGSAPNFVSISVPRGAVSAGFIVEVRSSAYDRTVYLQLQASGYGATIQVDIEVR